MVELMSKVTQARKLRQKTVTTISIQYLLDYNKKNNGTSKKNYITKLYVENSIDLQSYNTTGLPHRRKNSLYEVSIVFKRFAPCNQRHEWMEVIT